MHLFFRRAEKYFNFSPLISARRKNIVIFYAHLSVFSRVACHNRRICPIMVKSAPKFPPGGNLNKFITCASLCKGI